MGVSTPADRTTADHIPDIDARHPSLRQLFCLADGRTEQRSLAVIFNARRVDIGVEIGFELVMARHFIDLAVFLAQAKPPAFFLRKVILEVQRDDGTDTREG
jgi:hypothetical protein